MIVNEPSISFWKIEAIIAKGRYRERGRIVALVKFCSWSFATVTYDPVVKVANIVKVFQ